MDVNHWQSNFNRCLEEIEKVIRSQSIFSDVNNELVDTVIYRSELQELLDQIITSSTHYSSMWGIKWYERVIDIIPVENRRFEFRSNRD